MNDLARFRYKESPASIVLITDTSSISQGVIFSVNYDVITSTIISTSDDRSVRTWTVKHRTEGEPWKSRLVFTKLE